MRPKLGLHDSYGDGVLTVQQAPDGGPRDPRTPSLKLRFPNFPVIGLNQPVNPELPYIPFSPPSLGEEEIQEVVDTLRSDWITTGPKTKRFEQAFAESVGAEDALALNSCTAGLHVALATLELKPGDEVITTPTTFAASVNVIEHVGARPVLADVEPDTLNLDPEAVRRAVTPRTRALLPVHFAGHPANLNALRAIAAEHRLAVVEDAAHAVAAKLEGRPIGESPSIASFSFYATKNLCTAEGGMLVGPKPFLDRARLYALHGMNRDAWNRYGKGGKWFYEVLVPGFKYNMTDIQASLGLWQLKKLPARQARRKAIVERYRAALRDEPALELPVERPGVDHAWHLFVLRLRLEQLRIDRDRFIEELGRRGIGTSVHFIPVHLHRYYRDKYRFRPDDFPVAHGQYLRSVSLPLNTRLTDGEVDRVASTVLDLCREYRR